MERNCRQMLTPVRRAKQAGAAHQLHKLREQTGDGRGADPSLLPGTPTRFNSSTQLLARLELKYPQEPTGAPAKASLLGTKERSSRCVGFHPNKGKGKREEELKSQQSRREKGQRSPSRQGNWSRFAMPLTLSEAPAPPARETTRTNKAEPLDSSGGEWSVAAGWGARGYNTNTEED